MSIEVHIPCEEFTPIYTNGPKRPQVTLQLSIDRACGGDMVLGLYENGTNIQKGTPPPLNPGLNLVDVPTDQYLAVYCDGHDDTECLATYDVV